MHAQGKHDIMEWIIEWCDSEPKIKPIIKHKALDSMEFTPLFTLLLLSLLTITSLVLNTGLPEIRFTPKHNIWKQNALWPTAKKYYRCGDDDHDTSIGMSRMLANVKRRHGLRGAQSRLNLEESSPGCLPELLVDQRHLDPPGHVSWRT